MKIQTMKFLSWDLVVLADPGLEETFSRIWLSDILSLLSLGLKIPGAVASSLERKREKGGEREGKIS